MNIHIISVVPELLESPFAHSIMKRAAEKGLLHVTVHHLRKWAVNEYGMVDDYQFGGGAGMVMMCEPLVNAIEELNRDFHFDEIIYLTPDGETFNQQIANSLSLKSSLLFICGHYKGIDQRVRDHFITREISIGDFVMSGGERQFVNHKNTSVTAWNYAIMDDTLIGEIQFQVGCFNRIDITNQVCN
jgi:tRNA (guanine37-N1)-methyltransferase